MRSWSFLRLMPHDLDDDLNIVISKRLWLISLVVFALVVIISMTVNQGGVTLGIPEHQAAPSAERVDEIQTQWRDGGVRNLAIFAMVCDLAWIWIYALGGFQIGKGFATYRRGILRLLGLGICAAALVFAVTDYTETTLQLIQLLQDAGNDQMAGIASTMRPVKVVAFLAVFAGVILAWLIDRFANRPST